MKKLAAPALVVMWVFTWMAFIGLCIKTGSIAFNFISSLAFNPKAASNLFLGLNLSTLYENHLGYYITAMTLMLSVLALKLTLLWKVLEIFKVFKLEAPFHAAVAKGIVQIGNIALSAGILAFLADGYFQWLNHQELARRLQWGSAEFLMLAGVLFIVAQVFKKGVELQQDNELTV